jgi:hypothetical protein
LNFIALSELENLVEGRNLPGQLIVHPSANRNSPIHDGIVGDDHHIVLRNRNVEFQRIRSLLNGVAECLESILRPAGTGAAMPVNQDGPQCTVLVLRFM